MADGLTNARTERPEIRFSLPTPLQATKLLCAARRVRINTSFLALAGTDARRGLDEALLSASEAASGQRSVIAGEVREAMNKIASRLRTGARSTPRRIRRGRIVDATEPVRWQCLVSAQCLREARPLSRIGISLNTFQEVIRVPPHCAHHSYPLNPLAHRDVPFSQARPLN